MEAGGAGPSLAAVAAALLPTPASRPASVPTPAPTILAGPAPKVAATPGPVQLPAASSNAPTPASTSDQPAQERIKNQQQLDKALEHYNACRIHVSGFPPYTLAADLVRSFARVGAARVEKINQRACFAYLAFDSPDEARKAILANKSLVLYGEFLVVKPCVQRVEKVLPRRDFTRSKQKGVIVEPQKIDLSGDFHQQVDNILAAVRLTQEEATFISTLYADVERVLQTQWPGCVAMPFGSITTGLGIKSSDADCFVQLPPHLQGAAAGGAVGAGGAGGVLVNKAKRVLQSFPQLFTEILAIPRANTPIVKFFHVPTETNCDLSFKTPLGAQNSKLIAFLLQADARLVPMAVLVKYWAKVHGFSGTGKLTNYALTMLIVFYLQQPAARLLPAVERLQQQRAHDVLLDHWNTGFAAQRRLLPAPATQARCLADLLGGFFDFYALFNFDDMVVCPFLGCPVKKELFRDPRQLPDEFDRYKRNVAEGLVLPLRCNTPVCVQDPFEQSHNVASAVTGKLAAEIKAYFKFAANAYEKEKADECRNFLKIILLQKPKIVRAKAHPEYRINLFSKLIHDIVTPDWKSVVRNVIFTIFEKMLKIKLGKVEEKVNPESKKEKERYMGSVTKAIWRRKQFSKLYSVLQMEFLEKQSRITEEIITTDKEVLNLQFQMTITYAHDPRSSVVLVKMTNGDPEKFKEFGKFFISSMQNWFMIMLRPYTKPSTQDTAAKIAATIKMLDSNMNRYNDLDSDDDDVKESVGLANGPDDEDKSDKDNVVPATDTVTVLGNDTKVSDTLN